MTKPYEPNGLGWYEDKDHPITRQQLERMCLLAGVTVMDSESSTYLLQRGTQHICNLFKWRSAPAYWYWICLKTGLQFDPTLWEQDHG